MDGWISTIKFTNFVTSSNVRMKEKKTLKELHFKIKFHFILFYIVQTDLLIGGKIDLFFSQRYNTCNVVHIG